MLSGARERRSKKIKCEFNREKPHESNSFTACGHCGIADGCRRRPDPGKRRGIHLAFLAGLAFFSGRCSADMAQVTACDLGKREMAEE
jgi:hypothetical protein